MNADEIPDKISAINSYKECLDDVGKMTQRVDQQERTLFWSSVLNEPATMITAKTVEVKKTLPTGNVKKPSGKVLRQLPMSGMTKKKKKGMSQSILEPKLILIESSQTSGSDDVNGGKPKSMNPPLKRTSSWWEARVSGSGT